MATEIGRITARPTLRAYANNQVGGYDEFLAGTGELYGSSSTNYGILFLYGFNFEKLRTLENVKITNIKLSITCKDHRQSYTKSINISCRIITDFYAEETGVTSSYTDIGDGLIYFVQNGNVDDYTTFEKTEEDMPNTLKWINSNLTSFLDGFTSGTFGLRLYAKAFFISAIELTVDYTYESGVNSVNIDTSLPSGILIDTSAVKEVYIDKTKVWG